jgi:hypothetical protein
MSVTHEELQLFCTNLNVTVMQNEESISSLEMLRRQNEERISRLEKSARQLHLRQIISAGRSKYWNYHKDIYSDKFPNSLRDEIVFDDITGDSTKVKLPGSWKHFINFIPQKDKTIPYWELLKGGSTCEFQNLSGAVHGANPKNVAVVVRSELESNTESSKAYDALFKYP